MQVSRKLDSGMFIAYSIATYNYVHIHTAFIAWALLGTESSYSAINFYIGSLRFSNWRLFLIICTFPAFLFTFLMLFMPESPAYLFQVCS